MREHYYFSNDQIRDMKLCLGFKPELVTGTKYRKFIAKRNAYFTKKDHEYWNKLCDQGLSEKSVNQKGEGEDPKIYKLSVDGISLLEQIMDLKIEVEPQSWKIPEKPKHTSQELLRRINPD